jgi:hypothetical protein
MKISTSKNLAEIERIIEAARNYGYEAVIAGMLVFIAKLLVSRFGDDE